MTDTDPASAKMASTASKVRMIAGRTVIRNAFNNETFVFSGVLGDLRQNTFRVILGAGGTGGGNALEHVHPGADETFFVTAGRLKVVIAGNEQFVEAGQTITVPRGTPHWFANAGHETMTATVSFDPPQQHVRFFRNFAMLTQQRPQWFSRTVYGWFIRLRDAGTWESMNHHLVMLDRERAGREASPTASVIDSQSVKTTESGGVRGYDGGKKIKGRKRHALVDTDGRALKLQVHAASVQDRDGAGPLLRASRPSWPFVEVAFADAGYQGPRVATSSPIRVQIVRKTEGQVGFAVIARRWVVERFLAWINRNRRLAKDFERTIASAEAFLYAASSMLLLRRLGR